MSEPLSPGVFAATVPDTWQGWGLTLVHLWEAQPRDVFVDVANNVAVIATDHAAATPVGRFGSTGGAIACE